MIDFCRKIEAEMLAIDGMHRITEDLESTLRTGQYKLGCSTT
jgi:septum formation inhibitor MinC